MKKIDIYGKKLGFNLKRKTTFNSTFGGIFTILTFIFYVIFFILFSKDLYFKINPKVIFETVYITENNLNNYTLTNETFLFAIYSPINFKDPNLYELSINFISEYQDIDTITKLDFISCGKTKYSYLFSKFESANEYYCLNFSKIVDENLTNIYFSKEVLSNYLTFTINYNDTYLSTLNNTYKQKLLKSKETIFIYYPKISFSPNNYEVPLDIQMDYSYFDIN